jgi:hypothetical protein
MPAPKKKRKDKKKKKRCEMRLNTISHQKNAK